MSCLAIRCPVGCDKIAVVCARLARHETFPFFQPIQKTAKILNSEFGTIVVIVLRNSNGQKPYIHGVVMSLLCLLPGEGSFQMGLRKCLNSVQDGVAVEYCASLTSLFLRLQCHACSPETVVLLAADAKSLDRLLEHKELFSDLPLVLLLADEDEGILAKGHLLRPRFMTSLSCDPGPVKQVLCNLLKRQRLESQVAS